MTTVIGLLGTTLDAKGQGPGRWNRWRPSVSLASFDDLLLDTLVLLYQPQAKTLAKQIRDDIAQISTQTEVVLTPIAITDPWDLETTYSALLDFTKGFSFSANEDYLTHITTGSHIAQISLFLLNEAGYLPGKLVQTSPPKRDRDASYQIIDLDLSQYNEIAQRFAQERLVGSAFLKSGIATRNARFNQLIDELERVAIASPEPILLLGPTGAGKSQLAARIYELKKQRGLVHGDFVAVNCATLRGDNALSALFGHTRGAFTGASSAREGYLRRADSGILFLDEIAELSLEEQAALLHAIEHKSFFALGSDTLSQSSFQLIAGSNVPLHAQVAANEFREDLLARIDMWTYQLPGLAERKEDIEPNLDYELETAAQTIGRKISMTTPARRKFLGWANRAPWHRNFRDLHAAVTRMATLCNRGRIEEDDVAEEIERLAAAWGKRNETSPSSIVDFDELDHFDAVQLREVIAVCQRSSSLAAAGRALFAVSRRSRKSQNDSDRLRKYLARFGLQWADIHEQR